MPNELLLGAQGLKDLITQGRVLVVDCRFDLTDSQAGNRSYLQGHIPGAVYAHLDHDLSSAITDQSGRHPLPGGEAFAKFLGRIGWTSERLLVAYDESGNAFASRLWWLMQYFGCEAALLDGGLSSWIHSGFSLKAGNETLVASEVPSLKATAGKTVSSQDILNDIDGKLLTLVDARAPERFSGEVEPLDTSAGHIPGALNRPLGLNLDASGRFKSPGDLRAEFEQLLGQRSLESVVHSCGSGVTACHNLFAMQLAGLGETRIYPGSWSEWIRDPARPVATGR